MFLFIALESIKNRKISILLVIFTLSLSVSLFLSVTRLSYAVKKSFENSIAGVDLIVGARTGDMQLLLYTVFHQGLATNNISVSTLDQIAKRKDVEWLVPIALGDSHRGYRVIATTKSYFRYIKTNADGAGLDFKKGEPFEDPFDMVIGAEVAKKFNYQVGDLIKVTHGTAPKGKKHDDFSFKVSGILKRTGSPQDKALFMTLGAYEAIHIGWKSGQQVFSVSQSKIVEEAKNMLPSNVTAGYIGLVSPVTIFRTKQAITNNQIEALSAILPGVTLARLWKMLISFESILSLISGFSILIALIAFMTISIISLENRHREMTILRSVGASPIHLVMLLILESSLVALAAIIVSLCFLWCLTWFGGKIILEYLGVQIGFDWVLPSELIVFLGFMACSLLATVPPCIKLYLQAIHKGLAAKL